MKFQFSILFFFLFNLLFSQGAINNIEFVNIKKNKPNFLKQILISKEGEILDSLNLKKDVILLNRLNGISKSDFQVIKNPNNTYNIIYNIVENFSLIPAFSLWTTKEGPAFRTAFYDFNFLGRNITIGGFYQYNTFNSVGFIWQHPIYLKENTVLKLIPKNYLQTSLFFLITKKHNTNTPILILKFRQCIN